MERDINDLDVVAGIYGIDEQLVNPEAQFLKELTDILINKLSAELDKKTTRLHEAHPCKLIAMVSSNVILNLFLRVTGDVDKKDFQQMHHELMGMIIDMTTAALTLITPREGVVH